MRSYVRKPLEDPWREVGRETGVGGHREGLDVEEEAGTELGAEGVPE
jgi:hypothetical protein